MRWWLLLVLVVTAGCRGGKPAPPIMVLAPPSAFSPSLVVDLGLETPESGRDPRFVFTSKDPSKSHGLLWCAMVGVNVGPYGTGFDASGTALPAFSARSYDSKEDIQPISNPLGLTLSANGRTVKPIAPGFAQSFDARYGVLTTHWFAPVTGGYLEARLTSVIIAGDIESRWEFRAPRRTRIKIARSTPLDSAWENERSALFPRSISDPKTTIAWDSLANSSPDEVTMDSGEATWLDRRRLDGLSVTSSWYRYVPGPLKTELASKEKAFGSSGEPRIEVEAPIEDQRAIDSFFHYLVSVQLYIPSPHLPGAYASARFSPFGLSSTHYNGHVFWDADVWLMPALAFIEPSILQDLADYRLSHMRAAPPAPFPWESSVTGKETAPGSSVKEIHISGSVLWGLQFAKALGAKVPETITKRVAGYYLSRATKRPDGLLGLLDVMSPDETHIGANDLYTNLVAQWAINGATWRPASKPAATMFLPSDATSLLTYENDSVRSYKQAAAVLSIYPLQYPRAEAQAKAMLERFQSKVTPNGPAMSDSIHATIWARLGEPEKAYEVWKKSWGDYLKGPMLLFSEKRSTPTTYFTTGAAGCLQSVIYGFLGFRVDEQPEAGAAWKLQLKNGRWLSIKPHLPSAWRSATFRNFNVLGRTYTLTVKREGSKTVTSVKQGV